MSSDPMPPDGPATTEAHYSALDAATAAFKQTAGAEELVELLRVALDLVAGADPVPDTARDSPLIGTEKEQRNLAVRWVRELGPPWTDWAPADPIVALKAAAAEDRRLRSVQRRVEYLGFVELDAQSVLRALGSSKGDLEAAVMNYGSGTEALKALWDLEDQQRKLGRAFDGDIMAGWRRIRTMRSKALRPVPFMTLDRPKDTFRRFSGGPVGTGRVGRAVPRDPAS